MAFECAQVFYLNPNLVANASEVGISAIDLYFKAKPSPTNNKSGIQYPGVSIAIVPTINGVPYLDNISMAPTCRVNYNDIIATGDASVTTTFRFDTPVQVSTGTSYAIIVSFDGDEDFALWTSVTSNDLLSTTVPSPGSSDGNVGAFYDYIGPLPLVSVTNSSNSGLVSLSNNTPTANSTATTSYTLNNWTPQAYTQLKFGVFVARYAVKGDYNLASYISNTFLPTFAQIYNNSNTVANASTGVVSYTIPAQRVEYMAYDRPTSGVQGVLVGERVYQNTVFWPGGATPATISVTANSNLITAISNNINWNSLLKVGGPTPEYIVLQSLNGLGANADIVNIRQVISVISNTVIAVDSPVTFTNTACYFMRSPTGVVDQYLYGIRMFGAEEDICVIKQSTANSSIRFANDTIMSVLVNAGGTGYANTDYVTFSGYEYVAGKVIGGYSANATISTNTSGGITNVYMVNCGAGFNNASAITFVISNSSGNVSVGTGANLYANVGAILKTQFLGQTGNSGYMTNVHSVNIEIGDFIPGLLLNNPGGTIYHASIYFPYYSVDDTSTVQGKAYYCDASGVGDALPITPSVVTHNFAFTKRRVLPSWSQELVIPYGANGTTCNGSGVSTNAVVNALGLTSNSSVITVNAISNNDFTAVTVALTDSAVTFFRYVVNNDYTGENTNNGNAWAKGIETQFNLANTSWAEDIVVYSTMYRPVNTDVKMFVRIYNTNDPDPFDDKDWTLLQTTSGGSVYSSPTNFTDVKELTWGFQPYPNTGPSFAGSGTSTLNSNVITGSNTSWKTNATANLTPNTLVVFYPYLFPNNYQVSLVTAVTNDTSFTIADLVTNNQLVASGLVVKPILYPFQAFNNQLNDNVVRYYNSNMAVFDNYNVAQYKIVMLSSNGMMVPMISSVQGVAVSA